MADTAERDPRRPISRVELVSLLAMLSATVAFSIDAMLPSLPNISADLSPESPNRAQLVISSFLFGMGLGTFFTGPLSDAFGRKSIAVLGGALYIVMALLAAFAQSIETLLLARFVQGIGAAGPRVASMAIVRDLFSGRQMAQILSYIIFVFSLTPIVAPSLGWALTWAFSWRAIFIAFALFSIISIIWLIIRQPETLRDEHRRPFQISKLIDGARQVLTNRQVVIATIVQTLIFATLFTSLMSSQQIFDVIFDRGNQFPLWFAAMGVLAAGSNLINARIVMHLGMREVVRRALLLHGFGTVVFLCLQVVGVDGNLLFALTFAWLTSTFFLTTFGIGNMNALALEPMGHIAGMAASTISATATIFSALIAVPIGLAFNGTMYPLTVGVLILVAVAYLLISKLQDQVET